MMRILLIILVFIASPAFAQNLVMSKDTVGYEEYHKKALELSELRKGRLLTVDKFLAAQEEEGVIVLDLRSKAAYDCKHIEGAIHLSASDLTQNKLAELVHSKKTKLLTYCDNSLRFFPTRMISLTDVSFPQIYALGYENIYELQDGMKSGEDELNKLSLIKNPNCKTCCGS